MTSKNNLFPSQKKTFFLTPLKKIPKVFLQEKEIQSIKTFNDEDLHDVIIQLEGIDKRSTKPSKNSSKN